MSEDPGEDIVACFAACGVGSNGQQRLSDQGTVFASLVDSPPLLREPEHLDDVALRARRSDDASHQPELLASKAELGVDLGHQLFG